MNSQVSENKKYLDQLNNYQLLKGEPILSGYYFMAEIHFPHPTSLESLCTFFPAHTQLNFEIMSRLYLCYLFNQRHCMASDTAPEEMYVTVTMLVYEPRSQVIRQGSLLSHSDACAKV
jgi:hypothetical protein